MGEITHEMWRCGAHKHDYSSKISKVLINRKYWSSTHFTIQELVRLGWVLIPIHIDLENK